MAMITDAELENYKKLEKDIIELKGLNQTNTQMHTEHLLKTQKETKKSKSTTIAIAIGVALLGIGVTYYYLSDKLAKQVVVTEEYKAQINSLQNDTEFLSEMSLYDQEVYAVQIGAFEKRDLAMYSESFVNFREIRNENFNKYALGNFASLDEAKAFRKELVDLGLKDAFIGFYQNGERQHIEKVVD